MPPLNPPALPPAGWYPAPDKRIKEHWWWDGEKWIDPVESMTQRFEEVMYPLMEKVFKQGFVHGSALAAKAAHSVLEGTAR